MKIVNDKAFPVESGFVCGERIYKKMKSIANKLKKLKEIVVPTTVGGSSVIVDYYIRLMLFLYPLFLTQDTSLSFFNIKFFLYFIVTLLSGMFYIWLIFNRRIPFNKRIRSMDICIILIAVLLLLKIVMSSFQNDIYFGKEIFLLCVIGTYYLVKNLDKGYRYYLNLLLFSAVILFGGFFQYYSKGFETVLGVEIILVHSEAMVPYLLLISVSSSWLYCITKKRGWELLYLMISIPGFLLLFLQADMVGICIVFVFLLLIPIMLPPTFTIIKKSLFLCFLFLLTLNSISLLQSGNFKNIFSYNIYIDMFLAITGMVIISHFKKIPIGVNPDAIILKKVQYWFKCVLAIVGIVFLSCVFIGTRILEIPERIGMKTLKTICNSLLQSINENKGFFQTLLEDYGVIGCMFWIYLILMIIKHLVKRWREAEPIIKVFMLISILFIVQSFFYQLQLINSPLYIIILSLALFAKTTKSGEVVETDSKAEERFNS